MGILEINMQMLHMTGFWIDKNESRGLVYYIKRGFVTNSGLFILYALFYGVPMYIYEKTENFSEVSECLGNFVSTTLSASIFLTLVLKNDELKELVQLLRNVDESFQPTNEHTKEIYEKTKKLCHFWSVTFPRTGFAVFAFLTTVVGVDLFRTRDIENRIKSVSFLDLTQPFRFEMFVVIFGCSFFWSTLMIIGCNLMILCMFLNVVGQLRMLNCKISNLRSSAEAEIQDLQGANEVGGVLIMGQTETSKEKFLVEIIDLDEANENFQQLANSENDCDCMEASDAGYESPEEIKIRIKMQDILKECISHHCELINFIRAFEEHWNSFFSVNLTLCMALSVLFLTSTAMEEGSSSLLVHSGMVAFFYSMLGICCFLSQQITVESELLQESVYGCGWTESSKSFKRSIGIMVSLTNQPIVITAAGFIPLSLATFKEVLNAAYSTYMMLSSF